MDGFWFTIGLIAGIGIGSFFGIIITAVCVSFKRRDMDERKWQDDVLFDMGGEVPVHEEIARQIETYGEDDPMVRDRESVKYYRTLFSGMAREIGDRRRGKTL